MTANGNASIPLLTRLNSLRTRAAGARGVRTIALARWTCRRAPLQQHLPPALGVGEGVPDVAGIRLKRFQPPRVYLAG